MSSLSSWAAPAASGSSTDTLPTRPGVSLAPDHVCVTGFRPHATNGSLPDQPFETAITGRSAATVRPEIMAWMSANEWQSGYTGWQAARHCHVGFDLFTQHAACAVRPPTEGMCSGPGDGYEFLLMHRHMLQSLRSLWPDLKDQFGPWARLPELDQYPAAVRADVHAWPDSVRRAVETVNGIGRMSRDEVLARWADEGEFGQWLQCGSTQGGLHTDSLYGALITNAIDNRDRGAAGGQLNLYLFWKAHAWLDRAWDRYRKAVGKMPFEPQLQAALIKQCQSLSFWSEQPPPALPTPADPGTPLFAEGHLNPAFRGGLARVLGEVEAIERSAGGQLFIKLNPRLVGVKTVWVTGVAPIAETAVRIGERYVFIGEVTASAAIDSSGGLQRQLQSRAVLLAQSIQSPK